MPERSLKAGAMVRGNCGFWRDILRQEVVHLFEGLMCAAVKGLAQIVVSRA